MSLIPASRLLTLDVLRGVAILVVFVFHFVGAAFSFDSYEWNGPWRRFSPTGTAADWALYPITLGWSGVSLFFVLSGFVIHLSTVTASARGFSTSRFYVRRFWRIYPPYLLALVAFAAVQWILNSSASSIGDLIAHVLLVHNFNEATFLSINASFWSLATEVQFYLLYPIVVYIRGRFGMGVVLAVAAGVSLTARAVLVAATDCPYPITMVWTSLPVLWVDWVLGAFVAERYSSGKTTFGRFPLVWAAILAASCITASLYKPSNGFTFSLSSAAWAAVLDAAVRRPSARLSFPARTVAFVGQISYSLYLWHQPLIYFSIRAFAKIGLPASTNGVEATILTGGLTLVTLVGFASVVYFTVERWSMARGRQPNSAPAPQIGFARRANLHNDSRPA